MLEVPGHQYVLTGENRRRDVQGIVHHNGCEHSRLNVSF
jgi:hypothetical protein